MDASDLTKQFPEVMYTEDGTPINKDYEFFVLDCTKGFEFENKSYLTDLYEEVKENSSVDKSNA